MGTKQKDSVGSHWECCLEEFNLPCPVGLTQAKTWLMTTSPGEIMARFISNDTVRTMAYAGLDSQEVQFEMSEDGDVRTLVRFGVIINNKYGNMGVKIVISAKGLYSDPVCQTLSFIHITVR